MCRVNVREGKRQGFFPFGPEERNVGFVTLVAVTSLYKSVEKCLLCINNDLRHQLEYTNDM